MANTQVEDLTSAVRDAAYVSVGLGVIAFQRLQVQRNELAKALNGRTSEATGTLAAVANLLGDRVRLVEERLGAAFDRKG